MIFSPLLLAPPFLPPYVVFAPPTARAGLMIHWSFTAVG